MNLFVVFVTYSRISKWVLSVGIYISISSTSRLWHLNYFSRMPTGSLLCHSISGHLGRLDLDNSKLVTGSRTRPFDWCQKQRHWMTLNSRYAFYYSSITEAHHKNLNEDRPKRSAAKAAIANIKINYISLSFSVIPKYMTLNEHGMAIWLFSSNSVFAPVWQALIVRLSKKNYVKTNKKTVHGAVARKPRDAAVVLFGFAVKLCHISQCGCAL